jgi:hypothetical protein
MMVVQMDAAAGLLVARTTVGTRYTPETMRLAVESERRLAATAEIPGRPKLRFIILDPGAPAPGPKEREQFSKLAVDRRMPRLLGHVSDPIVHAPLSVSSPRSAGRPLRHRSERSPRVRPPSAGSRGAAPAYAPRCWRCSRRSTRRSTASEAHARARWRRCYPALRR